MPSISGVIGTSWPWDVFPVWVENDDVVNQAIHDVLFTALGERKMNLVFGSEVVKIVFENKGALLQSLATREISIAIAQHLSFINVQNIDVDEPEKDTDPVTITIAYKYQGVPSTTSEVVPTV